MIYHIGSHHRIGVAEQYAEQVDGGEIFRGYESVSDYFHRISRFIRAKISNNY
jgi:hypothetical protein